MPDADLPKKGAETPNTMLDRQYLVVCIGQQRYATPLDQLREVVDAKPCLPVPNSLPYVDGIMDLRGKILTVLDLSSLLGEGTSLKPCRVTLVVETNDGALGLNVEDVHGVVNLSATQVMLEAGHSSEGRCIARGVTRLDDQLVTLIDVSELVRRTPVLHA